MAAVPGAAVASQVQFPVAAGVPETGLCPVGGEDVFGIAVHGEDDVQRAQRHAVARVVERDEQRPSGDPFSCLAALAIRSRTGLSVLVTGCIANIPSCRFWNRPQDVNDLTSAETSSAAVRIR